MLVLRTFISDEPHTQHRCIKRKHIVHHIPGFGTGEKILGPLASSTHYRRCFLFTRFPWGGGVKQFRFSQHWFRMEYSSTHTLSFAASRAGKCKTSTRRADRRPVLSDSWATLGSSWFFALSGASYCTLNVGIAVSFGPPELPVYSAPHLSWRGYIWTARLFGMDGDDL